MKLASIFTNSMILQRDIPIKVFGTGNGNVHITFLNETVSTTSKDGKWCVVLNSHPAGGPYTMQISLNGKMIILSDILIGDVFLVGGQSNMEMPLFKTDDGYEEVENCENSNIRFFTVPRRFKAGVDNYGWHFSAVLNKDTPWVYCNKKSASLFSAIGYYFAKYIQKEFNVPIGIISCNWGGKKIEAFIERKYFYNNRVLSHIIKEYDELISRIDMAEYEKKFEQFLKDMEYYCTVKKPCEMDLVNEYGVAAAEAKSMGYGAQPIFETGPYDGVSAGNLWETMFSTIVPYTIKALLWYQGEANSPDYKTYAEKYLIFLKCFRENFGYNIPSYAVEIAPFLRNSNQLLQGVKGELEEKNWAYIREQQQLATEMESNNYLVTTQELGAMYEIHPHQKKEIARRLSLKVLKYTYDRDVLADQPIYESVEFIDGKAYITVKNAATLFGNINDVIMYIAGEDESLKRAKVEIVDNKICAYSDEVNNPILVRYAFEMYYFGAHIYNEAGLPLAPFRTDK